MGRFKMIHIAICDDEKDFVAHLNGLLNQYAAETGEEIKVTACCDGIGSRNEHRTEIVFRNCVWYNFPQHKLINRDLKGTKHNGQIWRFMGIREK